MADRPSAGCDRRIQ